MRLLEFANNILLEYKPDITVRTYGPKWLARVKNPANPDYGWFYRNQYFYNPITKTWDDKKVLDSILVQIEESDPTFNQMTGTGGKYIPWISRQYAEGNIHRLEDIANLKSSLGRFDKYKSRKDFPQEYRDINRLNARQLIDVMDQYRSREQDRGNFKILFDDSEVTVLVPLDEQASRYWGSSQWCTSGESCYRFEDYTAKGPLIIIIPKSPKHMGEKYQLHFETSQFMNENDEPINLRWLITERLPSLEQFFVANYGSKLENLLDFQPPEIILAVYNAVTAMVNEYAVKRKIDDAARQGLIRLFNEYSSPDKIIEQARVIENVVGERVSIENLSSVHVSLMESHYSGEDYDIDYDEVDKPIYEFLFSVSIVKSNDAREKKFLSNLKQIPNTPYVIGVHRSSYPR